MSAQEQVNILLVDDQPAKLLSYEVVLRDLGDNLIKASSAREAFEQLLKTDVAVVLADVHMPDLDGFQLAAMIRQHPRFYRTAIIFVSAVHLTDADLIRGYELGAVDYVPVPVIPQVLQAKVKVFTELYRKTRQLEQLNTELEDRVAKRTAELEASMDRQSVLAREVDHRAKNTLAVVQSIVRLTRAKNTDQYVSTIDGRIRALSRAHILLSESRWEGANLRSLVEEELAPYRTGEADKVGSRGPDVSLDPATAQTLALTLHELATNAAKHGALSSSSGKVNVSWAHENDRLAIMWTETGGPPTRRPRALGFGTRVINASIDKQLGGLVELNWKPEGLECILSFPHRSRAARSKENAGPAAKSGRHEQTVRPPPSSGNRVLLVEDEALVALLMADQLTELGFVIVGPLATVTEALAAVGREAIDAAVLDVNLGGELVYPVADMLAAKGVPFLFVTGYGLESIADRFVGIPVVRKPIEPQEFHSALTQLSRCAAAAL